MGIAWSEDGSIIFNAGIAQGLKSIPASGGDPRPLATLAPPEVTTQRWPQALPGGKLVLYSAGQGQVMDSASLVVYNRETGALKTVLKGAGFGRYLYSGQLLYLSRGTLFAAAFDLKRLEVTGSPIVVLQDVKYAPDNGGAQFDVSNDGLLVYRPQAPGADRVFQIVNENGEVSRLPIVPGPVRVPALSPDGKRIAYVRGDVDAAVWVSDLSGQSATRVSYESRVAGAAPVWSPNGRWLAYTSPGHVLLARSDGSRKPIEMTVSGATVPYSFRPDGTQLILSSVAAVTASPSSCMVVPLDGDPDQPHAGPPYPCAESGMNSAQISRDGKWIAYVSLESGRPEIYVRSYPDTGGKWQVTNGGGSRPLWSPAGGKLFYSAAGGLMAVPYTSQAGAFMVGTPQIWNRDVSWSTEQNFSIMPDGKRIVVVTPVGGFTPADSKINVILNFPAQIQRTLTEPH